jgi:GntR family transcriptional repressor for pyruvate dehydrogenase complex
MGNGRETPAGVPHVRNAEGSTEHVVTHVRTLIESGSLRPGDRLPAERDLATQIGVSRPTVRAGLRALSAMGVVRTRHGAGTFIPKLPALGSEPLSFLAALHGFTREEMFEARRILEVGAAGLAAERATPEQIATIAEEVASLFASMEDPQGFLVHDVKFHQAVAVASGNPIVTSLVGMVSELYYAHRRETAARASDRNLRDAAEMHRRIYQAIRARDPEAASHAMAEHLAHARAFQAEEASEGTPDGHPPGPASDAPRESKRGRQRRTKSAN